MSERALNQFFGGSPVAVMVRLLFLSLIVGALMIWLDIDPMMFIAALEATSRRIWAMGFDAFREVGRYIAAGALVVVPIWFLARLFSFGVSR